MGTDICFTAILNLLTLREMVSNLMSLALRYSLMFLSLSLFFFTFYLEIILDTEKLKE